MTAHELVNPGGLAEPAGYTHVVREIGERHRSVFGRHYPATALVEVAELYDPVALVEIVCTAVIP